MKKSKIILLSGVISILSICGCGVVSEEVDGETPIEGQKGYYLDSNVSGLQYTIDGCTDGNASCSGYTLNDGSFPIQEDKGITFHIAGMKIDYVSPKYLLDGAIITAPSNPKLLSFLQSLDSDGDASNGIKIDRKSIDALKALNIASYSSGVDDSSFIVSDIITKVKAKVDSNDTNSTGKIKLAYIDESSAVIHYQDTMSKYQPHTSTTVQSALDKLKILSENIESRDESSIASEILAVKTMVDGNHTLSGDRGTQDLAVAQALIEVSELTNQEYVSDTFDFKNSGVPNLTHFVKDMTFTNESIDPTTGMMTPNTFNPFESLTSGVILYKDENSTNLVANADKMSQQTVTKLKAISDKLGKALATMPRNYKFSYDGTTMNIDQFQALRASLLAMASKLSFMSAYAKGDDSYYKTQVYTEGENSYEYHKMDIYGDDLFNDPKFGVATDQTQLGNAKIYLMESSRLLKDLDAIGLDENHTSAMQTNIDYASSLYKILKSGSGIWELKDVNTTDSVSIDVNRLYNTSTAIKVSDFGTTWKEECAVNYTLAPVADRIKHQTNHTIPKCIKTSNSTDDYNYRKDNDTHMKPSTKPTISTSGLDDIITKIVTGGVTKIGQEILDHYTLDDSSNNDNIAWAKIINKYLSANYSPVMDITTDSSGNVFVAGRTNSSFDGQTNQGSDDGFVTKYSTAGVKLWTRFVGGSGQDNIWSIATDSSGNVFLAGNTNSSFDGQTNQGSDDGFVTKFDSNGDKIWTKFMGGNYSDFIYSIKMDASGNIFVGGSRLYKLDSSGSILASGNIDYVINVVIVKGSYIYTADGAYITKWNISDLSKVNSVANDRGNVRIDDNGYMYVYGYDVRGYIIDKLDPNGSIVASSSFLYANDIFLKDGYLYVMDDSYIKKLNTSDFSTVKVFNNAYHGNMLTVDSSGNIFRAGTSCEDQQNCSTGNYINFIMKVTQ